jgi:oligosaccharide repeat unit polymerase
LIVIVIFQIVGFLLLKKIINYTINISKKQIADNKIDSSFFIIMILITILPYLYVDISQMLLASELGYVDAYKFGNSYFLSLFVNFFLISLFGFLTSTNNRKLGKMIIFIFAIWNVIKMFTVGNRSQPMAILLALVFIYISISKPKKIKIKPIHIVFGLLILLLLPYIAYIRNSTSNTNEYSNFIFYLLNDNPISYLLAEFGGTILTLFTVIDIVPEIVSFSNGLTYLGSLTILLPFSTTIFGGYFSAHISVGETMNSFFGGGLGGSWIAELYFNFGYFGILFVPIYSFCIKRISDMIENNIVPKYTINRVLMFYMLIPLFIFPRGYFYTFVSYLNVYIYVAIAYFVYRRLRLGE